MALFSLVLWILLSFLAFIAFVSPKDFKYKRRVFKRKEILTRYAIASFLLFVIFLFFLPKIKTNYSKHIQSAQQYIELNEFEKAKFELKKIPKDDSLYSNAISLGFKIDTLKIEFAKKERIRKDSLAKIWNKLNTELKNKKWQKASKSLLIINNLSVTKAEKNQIKSIADSVALLQIVNDVNSKKYKIALPKIDSIIAQNPNKKELYYQRALCYNALGQKQEALNDLQFIGLKDKRTQSLYNKINPVRKEIIGYVTRCRDGSTSSARGRGACSHHGGVANWNEPIYREYRKYE